MDKKIGSYIIPTGLAIFSMFFGAGNLMYPINVGQIGANQYPLATFAFLITSVFLPLVALVAIILCNGNYEEFFSKIGKIPGAIAVFGCLIFIGPLYAMPRIVGVSHAMISPFCSWLSVPIFTILFLVLTFLISYKESRIMNILGNIISPALLVSLAIIIIKGFLNAKTTAITSIPTPQLAWKSILIGYETLDLFGAIFFSSIVILLLTKDLHAKSKTDIKKLAFMGLKAGLLGTSLLTVVYVGLSFLGAHYGQNVTGANEAVCFSTISMNILGSYGAIIVSIAVLMACLSTVVALSTILSEYLQKLSRGKLTYIPALLITLTSTGIVSCFGLTNILSFYKPIIVMAHPALIVLTFLIIANKLWGFKHIKLPVLITFILSIIGYYYF